jgi:hypothetical protein
MAVAFTLFVVHTPPTLLQLPCAPFVQSTQTPTPTASVPLGSNLSQGDICITSKHQLTSALWVFKPAYHLPLGVYDQCMAVALTLECYRVMYNAPNCAHPTAATLCLDRVVYANPHT